MKLTSKVATTAAGLVFVGSSVFAQSLSDAKKAIDAEQYQKAKSMLKNLTVTQANKDENYFYLGWIYTLQDYADSAKAVFEKGIAVNPKSALNYAGLGAVAHVEKDDATARTDFDKAISLAGKDSKPYVYVGKAYLLTSGTANVSAANANAAIAVLTKGLSVNTKDPELDIVMGDAYRSQLKSSEAFKYYQDATNLAPNSPTANVAIGVLWKYANNFDGAEQQFQKALSFDPNFGPAYREWAETDLRWAQNDPSKASAKVKEAVTHFQKFLSLTDNSEESQMRYADFLINAGDYKTLQTVAQGLANSKNPNLRAYRYLGYAAYENGDYQAAVTALNKWMTQAGPKRIIPSDYLYLGRAQVGLKQDSLGIQNLRTAYQMDSTNTDVFEEIAKSYYGQKKYKLAGDAYRQYNDKSKKPNLQDYVREGISYFFAFQDDYYGANKAKADTNLLNYASNAFTYVQTHAAAPSADVALYQARAVDLKETDRNNIKGLAKPYYEQYIQLVTARGVQDRDKKSLAEAYAYLGNVYEFKEKDAAKAEENFSKARELDPTNQSVLNHYNKGAAKAPGKGRR
jgi:tetratricopeptide (TPR) repeat protein